MAKLTLDPGADLAFVVEVANQVEASKDVDRDTFNMAKALNAMGDKLINDWGNKLVDLGATDDVIEAVANHLTDFASLFAPQANVAWDQAEVSQKLTLLEALAGAGLLSEEQAETLESVKSTLQAARKGGGQRAARTPQERVPGRPQFIISTYVDSEGNTQRLGTNAGNLPNSTSNVKTAAVKFINRSLADGESITQEQVDAIHAAIKDSVENGNINEVFGITFTPSETTEG